MPTTFSSARAALAPALTLLTAACALLAGGVALAGPAAAIEDPRRPDAEVTHGPSCGPAVVRVAVTNGTEAHHLALTFDAVQEEDAADLGPGEQVELTSGDVDWGRTVDVTLTISDLDGTAEEPIRFGTYTRPSAEDCEAVSPTAPEAPAAPTTTAPSAPAGATTTTPSDPSAPPSSPPTPGTTGTTTAPTTPQSTPPASTSSPADNPSGQSEGDQTGGQGGSASAASVSPGGVVTVRATGFDPGEWVSVSLLGADDPLTTVTAGPDGRVEAVVQIPRDAALGSATVQLVGGASDAVAGLQLQVAARSRPVAEQTTPVPVLAAGSGLIGAAAMLGLAAARRSRGHSIPPR